ncbi:MAG: hypothetical protein OXU75_22230 [Deltaproteobacteria bacterium]|nr:hypothetical protein [Deltaproteobacteria bacterium]
MSYFISARRLPSGGRQRGQSGGIRRDDAFHPAGECRARFGDGLEGRQKFTVAAPFGNEMIVAIASKSPLFSEDRPLVETERFAQGTEAVFPYQC